MTLPSDIEKAKKYIVTAKAKITKKEFKKAEQYLLRAIKILEKNISEKNAKKLLFEAYQLISYDVYALGLHKWDKVQFFVSKYLSYDKKLQFPAHYYYLFAISQQRMGQIDLLYNSFKRAYRIAKKQNDYKTEIFALNELGNYYSFHNKPKSDIRLKNIAFTLLENIKHKLSEEEYNYRKGILCHDISLSYSLLKNYKKVFYYFDKYLLLSPKEDGYGSIVTYLNGLNYAIDAKDLQKAEEYKKIIFSLIKNVDADILLKINYYETIYKYYEMKKMWKKASEHYEEYINLMKRKIEEENKKNILELQTKFEVERKKQEKRIFQLANKKLKLINTSKDKFFSIIAHDLRSPFATIYSFISLMQKNRKYLSPKKIMELILELEKVVKNTYSLLENLLEWSRLQTGVLSYTPTNFDICSLIKNLIDIYSQNAEQKLINISFQCDNKINVFADKFMIGTIIRNLINNAIKFTHKKGSIIITSTIEDNKVVVSVTDNGIGMTKEETEKLFKLETNFSKPGTEQEKGTGLGLILCKEFAKKNKADLVVTSKKNEGTTFSLYLNLPKQGKNEK